MLSLRRERRGRTRRDLRSALVLLGGADDVEEHLIRNFREYAQRDRTPDASL